MTPEERYAIFKKFYKDDILPLEDKLFELVSLDIPVLIDKKYPLYVESLVKCEDYEAKQSQRKLRENLKYFNAKEQDVILEIFPESWFDSEKYDPKLEEEFCSRASEKYFIVSGVKADFSGRIKQVRNIKRSEVINDITDSINFTASQNTFNVEVNEIDEFHPSNILFVRKCYKEIFEKACETAKTRCVAVIGDPGIGKSTLLRALFSQLLFFAKNASQTAIFKDPGFKKVFWVMESGAWRYFDGVNLHTGTSSTEIWREKDVLLLIDGSFKNSFLSKVKQCILFCSPDRSNYHKWIKMNHGKTFIMPPWSLEELYTFFDSKPNASVASSLTNGEELFSALTMRLKKVTEEMNQPAPAPNDSPSRTDSAYKNTYKSFEDFSNISPDVYDEVDVFRGMEHDDPLIVQNFLKDQMRRRFDIVGGKFRIIFDSDFLISDLKDLVHKCLGVVSLDQLNNVESLDYYGSAPSILYTMIPESQYAASERSKYSIRFSSSYVISSVNNMLFAGNRDNFEKFCRVLKNHRFEGALFGQLFEDSVLKMIMKNSKIELNIRNLSSKTFEALKLNQSFEAMQYDAHDDKLKDKVTKKLEQCTVSKCILMYPDQLNAPSVDFIIRLEDKTYYFVQVTISKSHPVKNEHIASLCSSLGISQTSVNLMFLVPEHNFNSFTIQPVLGASNRPLKSPKLNMQIVASLENFNDLAKFYDKYEEQRTPVETLSIETEGSLMNEITAANEGGLKMMDIEDSENSSNDDDDDDDDLKKRTKLA